MRARISKKATCNGEAIGFVVKVRGQKFPKERHGWYFPKDKNPTSAMRMALSDYDDFIKEPA